MIDHLSIVMPSLPRTGSPTAPQWYCAALRQGLDALGVSSRITVAHPRGPKHAACWGWRRGSVLRNRGYEVLVLERGYIGDRYKYTSLGWNGLNNRAEFPGYPDDGGERFRAHGGIIKPWREGGDYVLILGQVRGDMSLAGRDITGWYAEQAQAARKRYGLPVYFRPHPLGHVKGFSEVPGVPNLPECTLDEALAGALCTVAYNSNSCLDSILEGVPCFAGDRGTMAWQLCMRSLDELDYPDREGVVHRIAWTQWAAEEIESGEALRRLIDV